eukprot:CAMPEP_0180277736 /NCGR_PEP_ID=MMETSP0988-20121125/7092_1 /TAXON_ID=697907 /ORGANISM="non described non described, Strain CCMP2293" /LENGTH=117 /DNA_ID=CAMNT_0022249203 /DNA_START=413 /DNA_END=762 /DNA_ORIENTATION=+
MRWDDAREGVGLSQTIPEVGLSILKRAYPAPEALPKRAYPSRGGAYPSRGGPILVLRRARRGIDRASFGGEDAREGVGRAARHGEDEMRTQRLDADRSRAVSGRALELPPPPKLPVT